MPALAESVAVQELVEAIPHLPRGLTSAVIFIPFAFACFIKLTLPAVEMQLTCNRPPEYSQRRIALLKAISSATAGEPFIPV